MPTPETPGARANATRGVRAADEPAADEPASTARHRHVDYAEEPEGYGQERCLVCDATPATLRVRWRESPRVDGRRAPGRSEGYYYCSAHQRQAEQMRATLSARPSRETTDASAAQPSEPRRAPTR